MIFLDPTIDIAFKKLFGDQAKQEILISFLNSVLGCKEGEKIVSVVITDPYNTPDTPWLKTSIVDIRCIDQRGRNYIVELQVENQDDYPERSQYYAALAMARQLKIGGKYGSVMPVIFIGILDFDLFENDSDYLTHHKILNTKTHAHSLRHLEFHFIELKKFNKSLDQLDNVIDKWIFLLKNASTLTNVPKQLTIPAVLKEAMEVLEQGSMSQEELTAYDRFIDARRVAESVKETNIKEGMQKGREETQCDMVLKMLSKLSIDQVADITGLSIDAVEKIKALKK
ncbi:Rpn family recombination-promoting nuclease/putative transposase [Candidatus Babeliales bacterium]|nr:Rpn family recombination-promoting nuclease/putative transposase [Candidatus Babeliales bacterium]